MRVDELDYELPAELIATRPAEPRDAARMLVMRRHDDRLEHRRVRDLPEYLVHGDCMVFNDTTVTPARIIARRVDSGGRVEGLFLETDAAGNWRMMLRSNGRLRPGIALDLIGPDGSQSGCCLRLVERDGAEWLVHPDEEASAADILAKLGRTPLPPYILRARGGEAVDDAQDRRWYQTVYADAARADSVAAPTAGLHFTNELLTRIDEAGVRRLGVTLHVGAGTFQPVNTETLAEHRMHEERFETPAATLEAIRDCRGSGGRSIAVGTTSIRALESVDPTAGAESDRGQERTNLLIAPPYSFNWVDGLLTNFHLPRSTLMALVAAMVGIERLHAVYAEAMRKEYRFYSYGDAMLILP